MPEMKMSSEIKDFLTSRAPFSPSAVIQYTPEMYKKTKVVDGAEVNVLPDDYIPSFSLRSLRKDEKEKLGKALTDINMNQEGIKEVCRKAVLGWDRMYDMGTEALYEYKADPNGGCEKDCFAYLPLSVVSDICFYLSKISGLLDMDKLGL